MAIELSRRVVTDEASLVVTAPAELNEGEVYAVSIQNQGEGTVTLGGADVTAGAGRVDVDPDGNDVGRITLAASEELWAITDGDPATIFGTAGALAGQTQLVAGGGGGGATVAPTAISAPAFDADVVINDSFGVPPGYTVVGGWAQYYGNVLLDKTEDPALGNVKILTLPDDALPIAELAVANYAKAAQIDLTCIGYDAGEMFVVPGYLNGDEFWLSGLSVITPAPTFSGNQFFVMFNRLTWPVAT